MGLPGVITAFVLLLLHAVGVYRLVGALSDFLWLEVVGIIVGMILAVFALLGILFSKRWGWPLMLVVFSLGLANAVFLYSQLGGSITLALLFGVTVFAVMLSFFAVDLWEPRWSEQDVPQWVPKGATEGVTESEPKKSVKKVSRKSPKKSSPTKSARKSSRR